mgnify:CR=1 FL=1|tara:strand:- start:790 stop:1305 length:516 start_codon:yes stop_codon:yes gene_type:complete
MVKIYVKLIIGAIYADPQWFIKAKSLMQRDNWEIEHQSEEFAFDQTDYYSTEMGEGLKRCFLSIKGLQSLEFSVEWKLKTAEIEQQLSKKGKRKINLDPGYLDLSRVVLLSGKEGSHKIYLLNSVWADLVLLKDRGGYRNLPWTFPDIRTGRYNDFFLHLRREFKKEKSSG